MTRGKSQAVVDIMVEDNSFDNTISYRVSKDKGASTFLSPFLALFFFFFNFLAMCLMRVWRFHSSSSCWYSSGKYVNSIWKLFDCFSLFYFLFFLLACRQKLSANYAFSWLEYFRLNDTAPVIYYSESGGRRFNAIILFLFLFLWIIAMYYLDFQFITLSLRINFISREKNILFEMTRDSFIQETKNFVYRELPSCTIIFFALK